MNRKIKFKGQLKTYLRWPIMLIGLLAVTNLVIYTVNIKSGILMSLCVVGYSVIVIMAYSYNKPLILKELVNFATQYGQIQKRLLQELEIPYALLDESGKIMWMNKAFRKVCEKEKNYHKSITSIFTTVTKEVLKKNEGTENVLIQYAERNYRATLKKILFESISDETDIIEVEDESRFLTALYLFDETELNLYIRENQEQKLVTALLYIDNYEEVLESIEEVKQSLLIALIDRKINRYFSDVDGLIKKFEKDKYFIVFKQKHLETLKNDKFRILEEAKTVSIGNEMAVTLSIGMGVNGISYIQNYEYSRMAIDLALGRGGDQAVIKECDKISYYGGKAKQVEKSTRVKARVKAHALREIIESKERVLIMGHKISDVDSFGAALGIYRAAHVLGKKAYIVINEITSSIRPLKECYTQDKGYSADMFIGSVQAQEWCDMQTVVMVVDVNRPSFCETPELLKRTRTIVVFDHHRQGSESIDNAVLSYIEPYASSTCEMVAEVLQYFSEDIKLSDCEADCIYAGILIDTNNFMTKTGVRTFEAAAYLKRNGADVTRVRKMLRNDMAAYKARAEAVRGAEVYKGAFAISVCSSDNIESPTIAGAQAANELLNIIGIKASFVLTEYQNKVFVSSRSIDEINVQLIMERLGGGGHLNVAGAQLEGYTLFQAKALVEKTIDDMLREGEIQ